VEEPDYEIVASAENTPYLLWQAFLFHASCVQTQGVAPSIVVHGSGPLLPGFRVLAELGARLVTAPSYRVNADGVEYTCRNTAGSLAEVKHDRPWTFLCDPDFLFLEALPKRAASLCDGRAVSWDFVSYMQVGDFNRRWLVEACRERGLDPSRVAGVDAGGVVPNLVRADVHAELAPRWLAAVDTLVGVARRDGEIPWVTIAWGFALAAWELGLEVALTRLTQTTHAGSTAPAASLSLPILHYCYGDELFDKRRHQGADSAPLVWSLEGDGNSVSARFLEQLRAIRGFYRERELDVADPRLYRPSNETTTHVDFGRSSNGATYLDALPASRVVVGYGSLGLHGSLGYEDKRVSVAGKHFEHALSSHAPALLAFELGGRYARFRCEVALNDDVPPGASHADFSVFADGRLLAVAPRIGPGAPRSIEVNVEGAKRLELKVETTRWQGCHAVWLNPELVLEASDRPRTLVDALGRTAIALPARPVRAERCIATVASSGFSEWLDDLLGSIHANGNCPDALLVVFLIGRDDACERIAAKHGALVVHCERRGPANSTLKSVLYSAARVLDAERFLCLDADMLVLEDLGPVFATLDACPHGSLFACRETNSRYYQSLEHALTSIYYGRAGDLERIQGGPSDDGAYPLVVNDGLFAGDRAGLLALDGVIRGWPNAPGWVDELWHNTWRNQFVFNLALARLRSGIELDSSYNVQLFCNDVELYELGGRIRASFRGRPVRVLHFNGPGRNKYPEWRGRFARVDEPLAGRGDGDGYAEFLSALRGWIGSAGLSALAWSFYGTADGQAAHVRDPARFPLFALLHYLVRSNGCVRVLETGTARGVSAACLASAVGHRSGARVVTLDPYVHAEREALWSALPGPMRDCIDARCSDSVDGMRAALAAGERYEAALLDSVHAEQHVLAEFELAAELVCPGGLILVHDALLETGTVARALEHIAGQGYGVARLWAADAGVAEGERLGLAVIENRKRSSAPLRSPQARTNSVTEATAVSPFGEINAK
jgi:predicted O-methyltransferase YrrM